MEILQSGISGTLTAGAENFGAWQVYSGGRIVTATTTTHDPGAPLSRPIAGRKSIGDITLRKDFDPGRDGPVQDRLEVLAGTQTVFTIGQVQRDNAGNILRTKTRTGILKEVGPPEGDTNTDADKATLEIVLAISG